MSSFAGQGRQPPLLAARSSTLSSEDRGNESSGADPGRPPGSRPKRTLIESACSACRRRKSRCDGVRPSCSRCQTLRTECNYEAEEGESRWSALRRRNQILETETREIRELMVFLRSRDEHEAYDIFQRIRGGTYEDAFELLRELRQHEGYAPEQRRPPTLQHQNSSSMSSTMSSTGSNDQRLPPIRAMFDVSEGGRAPPPPLVNLPTGPSLPGMEPNSARSGGSHSRGSGSSAELPFSNGM